MGFRFRALGLGFSGLGFQASRTAQVQGQRVQVGRVTLAMTHRLSPPRFCRSNVRTFIVRIGFWALLIIIIVSYTPPPYSNYQGPYSSAETRAAFQTLSAANLLRGRGAWSFRAGF